MTSRNAPPGSRLETLSASHYKHNLVHKLIFLCLPLLFMLSNHPELLLRDP